MAEKTKLFRVTRSGYMSLEEMEKAYTFPELFQKLAGHNIGTALVTGGEYAGKFSIVDDDTGKVIARQIVDD